MTRARRTCSALAGCIALGAALIPAATAGAATPRPAAPTAAAALPSCQPALHFRARSFPEHPRSHNRWLSLAPGTAFVLTGLAEGDDGELHPHTISSVVSRATKTINGVRARVVFERDYEDGVLQESELAFQAESRSHNVWNLGEYPEEYDNGQLDGAPGTWFAGLAHAHAGIAMPARPHTGTRPYLQGRAPSVGFHDCAQVARTGQRVCIPLRCFHNVLVIKEWAPNDPEGGVQLKYYAPRIGAIRVGQQGGGTSAEELHLVRTGKVSEAALRRVDAAVLRQDRRGYHVSPHLYGRTPRARVSCHDD